jgi:hypothetical protein
MSEDTYEVHHPCDSHNHNHNIIHILYIHIYVFICTTWIYMSNLDRHAADYVPLIIYNHFWDIYKFSIFEELNFTTIVSNLICHK